MQKIKPASQKTQDSVIRGIENGMSPELSHRFRRPDPLFRFDVAGTDLLPVIFFPSASGGETVTFFNGKVKCTKVMISSFFANAA